MIARVRGVIARSSAPGSMPSVSRSTSTNTGTAPACSTGERRRHEGVRGHDHLVARADAARRPARGAARPSRCSWPGSAGPRRTRRTRARAPRTSGANGPDRTPRSSTASTAARSSSPRIGQRTCSVERGSARRRRARALHASRSPRALRSRSARAPERCAPRSARPSASSMAFLLEEVVRGRSPSRVVRRLEEHRELALDAALPVALGHVEQAHEVDDERRREDRVLAEEVDLHLHRHAGEADDVDVVPGLFRVAARLVVVDVDLVVLDRVADDGVEHA